MVCARSTLLALLATALVVSGCISRSQPPRVVAAPSQPVQRTQLPPPTDVAPVAEEALPDAEQQVASLPDEATSLEVGRGDLVGGWTVSSAGDTCGLFMSLTTWTGGYRASTRGCASPALAGISAWDVSGTTVSLKGGEGASPVASLRATSPTNFQGATVDGAAITVSR